jgi:spore maturation protein CgeB
VRFVLFYHSLLSDWNHGNAHFLRGIAWELQARGHQVVVCEPRDAWSKANLIRDHGRVALLGVHDVYPGLQSVEYDLADAWPSRLHALLDTADVVLVHEWNDCRLVEAIGQHRARRRARYALLFHDTHHRAVTDPGAMAAYDLRQYDGVLAFGEVLRRRYLAQGWVHRAWTWHEAADTRVFHPYNPVAASKDTARRYLGDLIWIGNWGDDERTRELHEFLCVPVATLGLAATVFGVRYPDEARQALARAGIRYAGWLPNYAAPVMFSRYRLTLHIPRGPYVRALPGIPTIRVFEALACGIPLVSAPWDDVEALFTPGHDYLVARNTGEVIAHAQALLADPHYAAELARQGRETVLARHTCRHRVDELLAIVQSIRRENGAPL